MHQIYAAWHKNMHFLLLLFFGKMRSVVFRRILKSKVLTVSVMKWFYAPSEIFWPKNFQNKTQK